MQFYNSCIHSLLQYLIIVWGQACKSKLKKLQTVQNRCLKILFNLTPLYSTLDLYSRTDHHILPIKALCELQTITFIHKILNDRDSHCNLTMSLANHPYNTRQANNLQRSRSRTCIGQSRISYAGPQKYDAIPSTITKTSNSNRFKTSLKMHLKANVAQYLL